MTALRGGMRATAATLSIGLGVLAASPALAADEVGHGQASALNIAIAGMGQSVSGTYAASNDGTKQTTSGSRNPALNLLQGSNLVNQGTLAQDATTSVAGRIVSSAACAGISGDGATLAQVGQADSCFATTNTLALGAGSLDFSDFDPLTGIISANGFSDTFLASLPAPLAAALRTGGQQLATQLAAAVTQVLDALGNPSLTLNATAIEGRCTATQGSAAGSSTTAGLSLVANLGSQANIAIPLTGPNGGDISDNPAPNTKVVTDLDAVTTAYTDQLTAALNQAAAGSGPLAALFTGLGGALTNVADLVNPIVDQVSSQLGPIEDNLLDITLNKQSSTSASQIHVTALDAQVLPAAAAATGSSLASIQLGDVDCLGGTAAAVSNPPGDGGSGGGNVPTSVDAGLSGEQGLPTGVLVALGALFLVAAGGVGVRRVKLHQNQD